MANGRPASEFFCLHAGAPCGALPEKSKDLYGWPSGAQEKAPQLLLFVRKTTDPDLDGQPELLIFLLCVFVCTYVAGSTSAAMHLNKKKKIFFSMLKLVFISC